MSERVRVQLGDVLEVLIDHRGKTPAKLGGDWVARGVRVVSAINIKDRRIDQSNLRYVSREMYERWMPEPLRIGDVLLTSEAPLGEVALVSTSDPLCTGQRLFGLRGKRGVLDGRFLYYLLGWGAPRDEILGRATGTTVSGIRQSELVQVSLNLPPFVEQRAIAAVLGALDDKIESNRRRIRLLEEAGRLELAAALAGSVGESWEFAWPDVHVGDVLEVIETGDRPKGGVGQITRGVPSIGAESIVSPGLFDFSKTKYVPDEYFESLKRGVLESGDVLLYKDGGTPGNFIPKVSMFQDGFPFSVAALNSHVYRLRVAPPYTQAFLYYWLSSQRLLDEMWLRGTGAAIPSLNSSNVRGLPFPEVPASALSEVLPVVDDIMRLLHALARESRTLGLLRDSLLPELLSGRMRVRDAEAIAEVVA